jgi:hypothetical protein
VLEQGYVGIILIPVIIMALTFMLGWILQFQYNPSAIVAYRKPPWNRF